LYWWNTECVYALINDLTRTSGLNKQLTEEVANEWKVVGNIYENPELLKD
jgi:hypothetical protein